MNELVQKALGQDASAQKQLYQHLAPKLFATCLRYVQSRVEAEDLLQEAFIKIFSQLHGFKQDGPIEAWARRITVNVILESFRKKKKLEFSLDFIDRGNQLAQNDINGLERLSMQELTNLINSLPDGKRVVFNLSVIEGFAHKEIAEMLSISEGTSKSQLSKAKEMLVEMLKKRTV